MLNDIEVKREKLNSELTVSLNNATDIITKNYLDKLESYDLIKPSTEDKDIDVVECGKFYKLSKLVVNKEENFLNKLTTIVNVVSAIDSSLSTIIKSDGNCIEYYLGIISKNYRSSNDIDKKRRIASVTAFKGAVSGNLVGSEVIEVCENDILNLQKEIFHKKERAISAISGIVALRDDDNKGMDGYVQGIENLVDSLKGQRYTIMLVADPVSSSDLQIIKQGYEMLHTQLSTFLKSSVTLNESDSISLAKARTDGVTHGITTGIAMTQSKTKSKGKFMAANASIGVNFGVIANVGIAGGSNSGTANTTGKTESQNEINQRTQTVTDTASNGKITGKSLQLNYENRSVKALLDKIDKHLQRLDMCESFGAFDCAAYVIADTREEALAVASNYNALMRGEESWVQSSHINTWHKAEDTEIINQYLSSFVHPRFCRKEDKNNADKMIVTAASIVSGNEMAIQVGLPKKSINGVMVVPMAPFGRNMIKTPENQNIFLGNLYHMGGDEGNGEIKQKVEIDIERLSMHTFITGSTGSGKSTAIYSILDKLMSHPVKNHKNENIKFMVIEPAKGEYKDRFSSYDNVNVYGTNYKKMPLLRINPFSFQDDIHVLEHIDRLIEIFNVCWPMYAAMPAVLKDAIERSYISAGWNLNTSECMYSDSKGNKLFPGFIDVLYQINVVMDESKYSSDSKGDYKGALCTRVNSLTNGFYGQIFTNDELSSEELFEENVIIDLSRTGSIETKSLIMGILVMKLQEHRMSSTNISNSPLKHITVLEEAHNLLKRTSAEQSSDTANLLGKSVEMLSNSIAEMRTYGEGFIIVDQAPGLMDMSVIRNTNTKIILRLPDFADRELVGKAATLNDEQIIELSRLNTFVAAVYQNDWLEPVLCNIDVKFTDNKPYAYNNKQKINNDLNKEKYIEYLLMPLLKRKQLDSKYVKCLKDSEFKLPISADAKVAFLKYTSADTKAEVQRLRSKVIYSIFNSEMAIGMAGGCKNDIDMWYKTMRDMLEPNINAFTTEDQKKIVAMIAREKTYLDESKESQELFNNLMKHM